MYFYFKQQKKKSNQKIVGIATIQYKVLFNLYQDKHFLMKTLFTCDTRSETLKCIGSYVVSKFFFYLALKTEFQVKKLFKNRDTNEVSTLHYIEFNGGGTIKNFEYSLGKLEKTNNFNKLFTLRLFCLIFNLSCADERSNERQSSDFSTSLCLDIKFFKHFYCYLLF